MITDEIQWPKFNLELHNDIIATIEAKPSCWKQTGWHCGTSHCYGGWAQIKSGKPAHDDTAKRDARMALGLTGIEANYAFSAFNSLEDLKNLPAWIEKNRTGFDRTGFDRTGFDRDGFDRDGFDRTGFDCDGLDINNNPRSENQ